MLTFVINGDSDQVTADQFRMLVDVAILIMGDAARDTNVGFTIGGLHASAPTIEWIVHDPSADMEPALDAIEHAESAADRVERRLAQGLSELEQDEGLPDWMSERTARALYGSSKLFGDTAISGIEFGFEHERRRRLTRRTYRTLDRVLHETTDAIGSVTGQLITATLSHGRHVTVSDEMTGRAVECYVDERTLTAAAHLIGSRVVASGRIRRDHRGRPARISNATVEPLQPRRRVTVAEMGGAFEGVGPDSVEWLREQRG